MPRNNIKAIVFDYDGTLYNSDNTVWNEWRDYALGGIDFIFKYRPLEEKQEFLEKYGFLDEEPTSVDICQALIEKFGNSSGWTEYISTNIYDMSGKKLSFIKNEFIKQLAEKYKLFIVSNSSKEYIEHNSKAFGFDVSSFGEIYGNQYVPGDLSKRPRLSKIINDENLDPRDILMVGDSFEADLIPALDLGLNVLHSRTIKNIYDFFNPKQYHGEGRNENYNF